MLVHWSVSVWMMPLLLVIAAGACVWSVSLYRQTSPQPAPGVARALSGLRCLALIGLVAAIGAPFLALSRLRTEPSELLVLVEDSASMALVDASPDQVRAPLSRWDRALGFCTQLETMAGDLVPTVQPVFLRGNGFAAPQEFLTGDQLVLPPDNQGSDLNAFLREGLNSRQGRPIGAVILISDGNETSVGEIPAGATDAPVQVATEPGRFFVVGIGDRSGPPDRALVDVRYPQVVHRGDSVQVDCVVEQHHFQGAVGDSMTIKLSGPQGLLAALTVPATMDVVPVSLPFAPDEVGLQVLTLQVSAFDNERFLANNKVSLGVSVGKERARLLFLTTAPGWDSRFFAQAALREPRLVMDVVFPGPGGFRLAGNNQAWNVPRTKEDWAQFDGVILEFADFPDSLWQRGGAGLLAAAGQGLGLLILPGPGFASGPTRRLPDLPGDLTDALPVHLQSGRWSAGDFYLRADPGASGHPVLGGLGVQGAGSSVGGYAAGWSELPPLRGVIPVTANPGATVLLGGRSRGGKGWPVLVLPEQGRVAWFGGDALWAAVFGEQTGQIKRQGKGHTGRSLLRNLLVWLGLGEDQQGLRILGNLTLTRLGQKTMITGIWQDMRGLPVTSGQVILQVAPLSDGSAADSAAAEIKTFAMGPPDPETGQVFLELPALAPGRYKLTLLGKGPEPAVSQPRELVVVTGTSEDKQIRQDYRRLSQIAALGNGQYVALDDSAQVAGMLSFLGRLQLPGRTQRLRSHYDLTKGSPFLVLVVVLLGLEWYLRRRHGLL